MNINLQQRAMSARQLGLSLVELMVAVTISLIVLAALSAVMVSTKKTNTNQNAYARMQENARIALQIVSRDVRQAGYMGCSGFNALTIHNGLSVAASGSYAGVYSTSTPLQGANDISAGVGVLYPGGIDPVPTGSNYDIVAVRYIDSTNGLQVSAAMPRTSADLKINSGSGLKKGDIVMVTDCKGGDLIQITGPDTADGLVDDHFTHNGGVSGVSPGNDSGSLSKVYDTDAHIARFLSNYYYVRDNTAGISSLYRRTVNGIDEELVEGIENMQIVYGIDTTGDGNPDRYVEAGSPLLDSIEEWKKVRTVRIGILAYAIANKTTTGDETTENRDWEFDTNKYDIDGDGSVDVDGNTLSPAKRQYHRRVFRTTVWIRNKSY